MNYIEINFEDVKGYSKLSDFAKELFCNTYKIHNSCQGMDYKEGYIPIKVVECKSHLKVVFRNKQWLHYYPNETWG